ncbi:hypothetical protein RB195_008689 [Necator americanus]|uniref:MSP domain-containing protein n=1 Tax=Necator americanus TaxID=51031 RepID=A0ABR1CRN7_NECAM
MSLKVEQCITSLQSAPAGTTVHRLVSLTRERIAFKVEISEKSRHYVVYPIEGFIDSGEMVRLTVRPTTNKFTPANLVIRWAETDDDVVDVLMALRGNGRAGQIIHPLNPRNHCDEVRYPSALLKVDDDEWADARRSWLLVKFGYATVAIRDENVIWKAVSKITEELSSNHIFLEDRPLFCSLSCLSEKQIVNDIWNHLQAAKPGSYPVLLLIDDYHGRFTNLIKHHFSKHMYIFQLSGEEVVDIAASSEERPFVELSGWCREFTSLVMQSEEEKLQSSNFSSNLGGAYFPNEEPPDRDLMRDDQQRDSYGTHGRPPDNPHHIYEEVPNGRHRPHGEYQDDRYTYSQKWEEQSSTHEENLRQSRQGSHETSPDDSRYASWDNHSNLDYVWSETSSEEIDDCGSSDSTKIATSHDIELALVYARDNRSDGNISLYLAAPSFFNRITSPFRDMVPNIKLMQLVNIACSTGSDLPEVYNASRRIIQSIVSSRYIQNVCDWFGYPATEDPRTWNNELCDFLVSIMTLFSTIDNYGCYGKETCTAWKTYYSVLTALPEVFWSEMPARNWLEEMAVSLKHFGDTRRDCLQIEQKSSKRSLEYYRNTSDFLHECCSAPPTSDYRYTDHLDILHEVGADHLGLLHKYDVDCPEVSHVYRMNRAVDRHA